MNENENWHNRTGDFVMDEPPQPGASEPVDVVQVRADDALIAALGSAEDVRIDDPIDERLADLLRSWRDDVHAAEPDLPLVDVAAAMSAVATAPRPRPRQSPFGPWATAAALFVIAFVGLGLAAKGAEPGDALWNVTKMLYSEKARSVEAAATVRTKLDEADQAIKTGNINAAMVALQEAKIKLPVIAAEDGQQDLTSRTEQLIAELEPVPSTEPPTSSIASPTPTTTESSPTPSEPTTTSEPEPSTSTEPPTSTVPTSATTPEPTQGQPSGGEPGSAPGSVPEEPPAAEAGGAGTGPAAEDRLNGRAAEVSGGGPRSPLSRLSRR